jgi:hypothetical protein
MKMSRIIFGRRHFWWDYWVAGNAKGDGKESPAPFGDYVGKKI